MNIQKKVAYSLIATIFILVLSMFLNIIPCQKAPVIPNPVYTWDFCDLNPDSNLLGIQKKYFGYTSSLRDSYIILSTTIFIISMLILYLITRRGKFRI